MRLSIASTLEKLPLSPSDKTGWPWTETSKPLRETMPNGKLWPKISIITPSYNQAQFLEETIRSVLLQGYPNLEYIIMDGCSDDGSVDVIERYSDFITYYVSEKDLGQADAINKGFRMATGDIFAWINSDDLYLPNVFWNVAEGFSRYDVDIIRCGVRHIRDLMTNALWDHIPDPRQMRTLRTYDPIVQPGVFWNSSLHKKVGELRVNLKYCLDWEFFVRLFEAGTFKDESYMGAVYRLHGDHKTGTGGEERDDEVHCLLSEIAPEYYEIIKPIRKEGADIWWYDGAEASKFKNLPMGLRLVKWRNRLQNSFDVYRAWLTIEKHRIMSK